MACKDARSDVQLEDLVHPLAEAQDCPQHLENPQQMFCETCGIQMCSECQLVEHKDHNTKSTKDVISRLQQELASYQPELLELEAKACEDVKKITKKRASLQERQTQELEPLRKKHRAEMQELDDKEALAQEKVAGLKSLSSDVSVAKTGSDLIPMLNVRTQVQETVKTASRDQLTACASTDSSSKPSIWGIEGDAVAELDKRLAAGADPNECRKDDATPLIDYCDDLANTARPLLLRRLCSVAHLNCRDDEGNTALDCVVGAAYYGRCTTVTELEQRVTEAIEVLLDAGADSSLEDQHGDTPRAYAACYRLEYFCSSDTAQLLMNLETALEMAENK